MSWPEWRLRGDIEAAAEGKSLTPLLCRYTCLESWKIMFLDRRRVPAIFVTTALAVFQQITFLNGVLFFLPDLLGVALGGPSRTNSVAASLTNSIINFFATAIAVYVADRFGRKPLFMEAGVQLSVAALVMAIALGIVQSNERRTLESTLPASQVAP